MIKANDAMGKFSQELEAQYKRAESIIDREIEKMADDKVIADLSAVDGTISPRVLRRLEKAYVDGGWTWELRAGDQRDPGPFVTLRIASPPRSGPGVPR